MIRTARLARAFAFAVVSLRAVTAIAQTSTLILNDKQYFESRGLNVFVFTTSATHVLRRDGRHRIIRTAWIATGGAVRLTRRQSSGIRSS